MYEQQLACSPKAMLHDKQQHLRQKCSCSLSSSKESTPFHVKRVHTIPTPETAEPILVKKKQSNPPRHITIFVWLRCLSFWRVTTSVALTVSHFGGCNKRDSHCLSFVATGAGSGVLPPTPVDEFE